MPSNSDTTPTYSRERFCSALKAVRERRGITLEEITAATKIPAYLIEGLERNDLRRWPKGLFRRSFFRDYARAIGLPVAEASAEFVKFFPDDDGEDVTKVVGADAVARQAPASVLTSVKEVLKRGAGAISELLGRVTAITHEPKDEAEDEVEMLTWITDARRVGPEPRVRVRIKPR